MSEDVSRQDKAAIEREILGKMYVEATRADDKERIARLIGELAIRETEARKATETPRPRKEPWGWEDVGQLLMVAFVVGFIWLFASVCSSDTDPCNASVADRVACDNAMYSGYDEAAQHDPR